MTIEPVPVPAMDMGQWRESMLALLAQHPFAPAWWLPNAHLQTAWTALGRRRIGPIFQPERWDTPDDDFLCVHTAEGAKDRPRALLLHGLEGSIRSAYILELSRLLVEAGWHVTVLEFRTCSGELNRAPRTYHLGETSDLDWVVERLIERHPDQPLYIAGVSLGGNVVLKWLGEQGANAPDQIRGAAAISCPFDVTVSGPHIDRALGGLYVRWFLRSLIPKALQKAEQHPGIVDPDRVRNSRTFVDYDTHATAAMHGFEDAFDYWSKCSCGQFLEGIRRPALLLTAADDPFNPASTLPHGAVANNPFLVPQFTAQGGHMGFVQGANPLRPEYWAEQQAARFFLACEAIPGVETGA